MKKALIIVGIIIAILLMVIIILGVAVWFVFGGGSYFIQVPKPEITYGEFHVSITYEINGEIKVMEDTVVCEFAGFEVLDEAGKYRKWKSHLKSGNERLVLMSGGESELKFEISALYGLPNYYMGDFEQSIEEYERVMADDRYLGYIQWQNGVQTGYSMPKEEVWEKYKLKILDVQYSQPIENSFK